MCNVSCIILNYNDASTTKSLVGELENSTVVTDLIVVDNCSTDDSWKQLKKLGNGKNIHVLRTERNGGYGMGNQAGISYAMEYLNPDYIVIANPDIHVTDGCMRCVREVLEEQKECALASALVKSPRGDTLFSYWDLLPLWKDLLDTGLLTRRIFKRFLLTPLEYLPRTEGGKGRVVGALPGSFFMLKTDCFTPREIAGLFDEEIFLYYEEKVLGQKLKAKGLKAVLVTDASYIHAHSVSIDKSISNIGAKQQLLHNSKLYYYKNYLGAGGFGMAMARIFLAVVLAEVRILTGLLKMRW